MIKLKRMLIAAAMLAMSAMPGMAGSVKSPNGNLELTFNINQGCAMYSLTYKGKDVVKPSRLGLELANDKHASKGMEET